MNEDEGMGEGPPDPRPAYVPPQVDVFKPFPKLFNPKAAWPFDQEDK